MHNFKELIIWKEAMNLAKVVYQVTASFPANEKFGLTSQINRSVVSIPSNIAEGAGRGSDKEFQQFLNIALGSAFELETQLLLGESFGFVSANKLEELLGQLRKIQRMIDGFKKKLSIEIKNKS